MAVSPYRRAGAAPQTGTQPRRRAQAHAPRLRARRRRPPGRPASRRTEPDDEYLVALAKQGAAEADDRMVRRYHGFVRLKASSYFLIGGDSDDLIQEGLVGLYKAIRDYRSDRESSFRNFAELCITRQIITAVKTATRNKHTPLNSYVSFSQTPAAVGRGGRADDGRRAARLDRPRPGQPGDLDGGDPEPGRLHHERAQRAREQGAVALPGRPLLRGGRRSGWSATPRPSTTRSSG